jgi:YXWGXW repeat-containing protein
MDRGKEKGVAKTMRLKAGSTLVIATVIATALTGFVWVSPALGLPHVYVSIAPPAPIVEVVPVAPSPRHVWIAGYHRWDGRAYVWVPGHYVVPPHAHVVWVSGHWAHHHSHGYYWVEGHWRHH